MVEQGTNVAIGPLDGIRVVELSNWMAAPSAAALLADMGADVIKVEPLTGDVVRKMSRPARPDPNGPDVDASFHADNRGKRSIAIAIDRPEGAALVRSIVAGSDVFLCNLLPRRQARFGLDAASLFAVRPTLVHATLTGYGLHGPDAERPGFDVTSFFGRGAVTDASTEPGNTPPAPRPAQGDHTTAITVVASILAALRLAERTGEGQVVDVSLMATAVWTMTTDLAAVLVDGRLPTKRDRFHGMSVLANRFRCADDRFIVLNMTEARWWPAFCVAVGHEDWITDERFATMKARYDRMPEITALIDALFAERSLADWGDLFDEHGLIWGAASTLADLAADPHAAASGMFPEIETRDGTFRTVGSPIRIDGAAIHPRGPAPDVGEHTAAVLAEVGVDAEHLAALVANGVVGTA